MPHQKLTFERLREVLTYDPQTGHFFWNHNPSKPKEWNSRWAGKRAGRLDPRGYRDICIDYANYGEHILAWLYMTGKWPPETVDHRDLVKSNNHWDNLRLASRTEQQHNRKARSDNASGLKGVTLIKRSGKWRARRREGGRDIHLGHFDTAEEAHEAYCRSASESHGEFFRRG